MAHVFFFDIPSPVGAGWQLDADDNVAVHWIEGNVRPQQLVDILECNQPDSEDNSEEILEQFGDEVEEDDEVDNILDIIFEDDQED